MPVLTISAGRGWLSQKERFGQTIAGNSLKRYTELPVGGLAYNRGASRSYWYGVTYVQDQHEKALVPNVYHSFLSKKNVTNELFVQQFFLANLADRELNKIITSSARRDGLLNINQKDFFNIKLFVPQIEEQEKIGEILKSLEKTITLNQEKLRVQKLSYKYYRDTLIADFQSLSTKINFNSSIWKAVKLKNILKEYVEKTTTENQTLLLSSTNNGIELRDGRVDGTSNIGYKILRKYSLVLSPQNL